MKVQNGDLVKVRTYGGQVVDVRERSVIVTTKEEFETVAREKRELICIGSPLSDVVEEKPKP